MKTVNPVKIFLHCLVSMQNRVLLMQTRPYRVMSRHYLLYPLTSNLLAGSDYIIAEVVELVDTPS